MQHDNIFVYTKQSLIEKLREIAARGWIANARPGNTGGVGNTLEDLLGIKENNLPISNAAEWELKAQKRKARRQNAGSYITLFHLEPSPRTLKLVPQVLAPKYGWPHQGAGTTHPQHALSFRQTIHGQSRSDRGFMIVIDRVEQKISVSFDASTVDQRHQKWLAEVERRAGLGELDPQPYWGFADLEHKAGTKLLNTFYVQADVKTETDGVEYYQYSDVLMLEKFNFDGFLNALEQAKILVDFDARTGKNHGTKFRLRPNCFPLLYERATPIIMTEGSTDNPLRAAA
jgi:hypothetical protein